MTVPLEHHRDPVAYPRCGGCAHPWHGLPCPVLTSVGCTPTCACPSSLAADRVCCPAGSSR